MRTLLTTILVLVVHSSAAHEYVRADGTTVDAGWIARNHPECCGYEDCEPVAQENVRFTPKGWVVDGLDGWVRVEDVRRSEDGRPWACRVLEHDWLRCLFLPGTGS